MWPCRSFFYALVVIPWLLDDSSWPLLSTMCVGWLQEYPQLSLLKLKDKSMAGLSLSFWRGAGLFMILVRVVVACGGEVGKWGYFECSVVACVHAFAWLAADICAGARGQITTHPEPGVAGAGGGGWALL